MYYSNNCCVFQPTYNACTLPPNYLLNLSPSSSLLSQVISHLLSQTARQELLSMLYEVELRRHQGTHRLLSATATQLDGWREEREKRIVSISLTLPHTSQQFLCNSCLGCILCPEPGPHLGLTRAPLPP